MSSWKSSYQVTFQIQTAKFLAEIVNERVIGIVTSEPSKRLERTLTKSPKTKEMTDMISHF
ncbi:hypothetical protein [Streptococcus jiangjianxini]|uniref:hypothetical protein n=1 Tax=Streptococcus jiangjianxini TaxID=3161189 RepID=UPI0032ED41D9